MQYREVVSKPNSREVQSSSVRKIALEVGGTTLLYLILTLVATYPAMTKFDSHFIGDGDTLVNAWNLWWVQLSIKNQTSPFHTTLLYYPDGVSLAYHTLNLFNGCLAFLFQTVLGMSLPATFNAISLLTFVGSGVSMFILVRSMTKSASAGLVSSLIFTFAPYRMGRVFFGNLDLYSTQFIPWVVFFLTKLQKTCRWRHVIGTAIALSLTGWCSLELGFGTGILVSLLFLFEAVSGTAKQLITRLKYWLVLVLLTGLFMSPFILSMFNNYRSFQDQTDQFNASVSNSADLMGFFVPDRSTRPFIMRLGPEFISRGIHSVYSKFYGNPCEKTVFLGYSVLAMVFVSLCISRSRVVRRWLFVAGVFFILCLGPVLHIAGQPAVSPMPYELFLHIPLLKFGRSPSRFAIFLMLALAIVVGYGCAALVSRWRRSRWIMVLVGVLIFIEFLIVPMRLDRRAVAMSDYYTQLADSDEEFPILDVPVDLYGAQGPAAHYMLYQTLHHQPIVGGYISRTPTSALSIFEYPFIYQLRARLYNDHEPYAFSPELIATAESDLEALGIHYVILHKDVLSEQEVVLLYDVIYEALADPIHEDHYIVVWERDL
ncbi:MAG: hypothetical protein ACP5J4_17485 [Anaerolineae bacterium]